MDKVSFDDVLGTNYTPTFNERCSIKTLVDSMEQELSSLNQVLLPLIARRDKLSGSIAAHKALLTPARRLPPELVSEIFTHATVYGGLDNLMLPRPRVSEAPLKLGRICRRWRQIALSTPSLWSSVTIPQNWAIEGLQEWIRRAGALTLSFAVEIHQDNLEVLELLASYQKQWKEVALLFEPRQAGRQLFKEFLESLSSSYGNLQSLDVQYINPDGGWMQHHIGPIVALRIDCAPNLRSLFLNAPNFKIVTPNTLPLLCLREICVDFEPTLVTDFLALLRLSPAVEVIEVHLSPQHNGNDSIHDILALENLKDLDIIEEYVDEGQRLCLLEKLYSPALERLCFSIANFWEHSQPSNPTHVPHIRSLINRSRPPLRVLKIQGYCIPAADIIYCIQSFPNLTCLHIEDVAPVGDWDGVVQLLTGPIPPSDENLSGCMCAKLHEIYFGQGNVVTPDLVIKMILSRSSVGSPKLSSVTVLSCLERDVLAHPNIMGCVANGLKFTASDTNPWARVDTS